MQPNQGRVCVGTCCSGKCAWHPASQAEQRQTGPSIFQDQQISPTHLCFPHSVCPPQASLQRKLCNFCPELYCAWRQKLYQGMIPLFLAFSNLWYFSHLFTVHTALDEHQFCYYTRKAAVLIRVLPLEFRITANFIGTRTSPSQNVTRAIAFMPALVSSLLPLDFHCLTFYKIS